MDEKRIQDLIRQLLMEIGEDPNREGLRGTPERVARSWAELTAGYHENPIQTVNRAIFESEANNMIIARDIEVYSM